MFFKKVDKEGVNLKAVLAIFTIFLLSILTGCGGPATEKELFTVDFQQEQTLRYKFNSNRKVEIDWQPGKEDPQGRKRTTESLEVVVAYTPIEVDPFGLSKIEAKCESIKARNTGSKSKDAVASIADKTFTFTVTPDGKIHDYSQLDELVRQAGKKAFRRNSKAGRVKEPDMIDDFIATQWFLWDSVSSIEKPVEGLSIGQNWNSQLSVPTTMVMRRARNVTYTLEEVRQTDKGKIAVIGSSYSLAKSATRSWPIPYSGRFKLAGSFGFFRMMFKGLAIKDLQGRGEELFNLDAGRTEKYVQDYQMLLETGASPLPGAQPQIKIEQHIEMELLGN